VPLREPTQVHGRIAGGDLFDRPLMTVVGDVASSLLPGVLALYFSCV